MNAPDPFAPLIERQDVRGIADLGRSILLSDAAADFLKALKLNKGGLRKNPETEKRHKHLARAKLHFRQLRDEGLEREAAISAACAEFNIGRELMETLARGGNPRVERVIRNGLIAR